MRNINVFSSPWFSDSLPVGTHGLGGDHWDYRVCIYGLAHEKFKKTGANVPTNLPATTFIVQGAYRFSRNPMYVGGSAFLLGIGIMAGSWWLLVAYIPLGLYLAFYVIP